MSTWSKGAEERWTRFCQNVRQQLSPTDVDPDEVLDDMRCHVETELAARNLSVITAEDLQKVLIRLELPQAATAIPDMQPIAEMKEYIDSTPPPAYQALLSSFGGFFIITFGVLLPAAAAAFELATHICSEIFFNPLPTIWHILLFYSIPLANLTGYILVKSNNAKSMKMVGFFNGLSIGVALFYTILFLPILPLSLIAIIGMGIGLCGLAPVLSLVAALLVRRRLRLMTAEVGQLKVPHLWTGLTGGLGILALLVIPTLLTVIGLSMAASPEMDTQAKGIRLIRTAGSKQYLLKRCYRQTAGPLDFDWAGHESLSTEEVRSIYYRVTGKSFNTERPRQSTLFSRTNWAEDWDFEQAGDIVGGQLKNLAMTGSQMDANLDADAAVGYLEWIMTFENNHQWQEREARCQVQLPPGGVVSRVTLWIDGQECEAAFGGRAQTKTAYQSVVQRQRDPVLVTTKGPDQVLVQCFPVPSGGGKMKIRLGISFPLELLSKEQALLQLPIINERNFQIPDTTQHQLWVEADGPLSAKLDLKTECIEENHRYSIRGQLTNPQLETRQASVHLQRNPDITRVWAKQDVAGKPVYVTQTLTNNKNKALIDKAVVVLDTSASMQSSLAAIQQVLNEFKPAFEMDVVLADDTLKEFALSAQALKSHLAPGTRLKGGMDNLPALVRAWDLASESPNAAIIWIHSAQPHLFQEADALSQRWMRRPNGPRLYHVQTASGPNVIIEALDGIGQVRSVARSARLEDDLNRLLNRLNGSQAQYTMTRERIDTAPEDSATPRASSHVVRLWAGGQVESLRAKRGNEHQERAIEIAVRHQLVTPVSGAVVLETKEQYERNNLQPVDPDTVPTIPEPASIALLGLGSLILARIRKRKRPA